MARFGFLDLVWLCILTMSSSLVSGVPHATNVSTSRSFVPPKAGTLCSISQVRNPRWRPHRVSTTATYASPFRKHNMTMPSELKRSWNSLQSQQNSDSNSVLETRVAGQTMDGSAGEFVFPVRVGTPSQTLYVMFDTGSGDFWLWSWQMPATLTDGHIVYNATTSTTSMAFHQSFNLNYLAGTVYGTVWKDTVWIDGNGGSLGVTNNPVEVADNVGGALASLPAVDGIMGLNTWKNDSESPVPQQTWLNYVLPKLNQSIFTVCLVRNGTGSMDFGFIDSTKYKGNIVYTPVLTKLFPGLGYWIFTMSGFAVGTQTFNWTAIPVLTDTGGNIVLLPKSITLNFYSHVKGAYQQSDGSWCFPCKAQLPIFYFGIGAVRAVIPSNFMVFAPLADGVNCYGAIQATGENSLAYFGTPFLEALFVVHDYGGLRMGFAERAY